MPIEYVLLKDAPAPLRECPKCGSAPFEPFMRGQVQSAWRKAFRRPYCSVICASCKEIVGHETPSLRRLRGRTLRFFTIYKNCEHSWLIGYRRPWRGNDGREWTLRYLRSWRRA